MVRPHIRCSVVVEDRGVVGAKQNSQRVGDETCGVRDEHGVNRPERGVGHHRDVGEGAQLAGGVRGLDLLGGAQARGLQEEAGH